LAVAIGMAWPAHAADFAPTGRWLTIDDSDGKPRSLVVIEERQGELSGHIEQIFPRPSDNGQNLCEKCEGARKNQPVVGMVFLWGLRNQGGEYSGGEILDPDNGKIYRAKLRLSPDGKQLIVRGYIGFSLFGRSQTWQREK
jgi:uncharacterized protein (DUF2147 family)